MGGGETHDATGASPDCEEYSYRLTGGGETMYTCSDSSSNPTTLKEQPDCILLDAFLMPGKIFYSKFLVY